MKLHAEKGGPGAGSWIALTLMGAFLAGALLESGEDRPRIGHVRLEELAAEFVMQSVRGEASAEMSAGQARDWAHALQEALDRVALRHGVVLLPSNAVVAGATDYTEEIRSLMAPAAGSVPVAGNPAAAGEPAAPGERSLHRGLDEPGENR